MGFIRLSLADNRALSVPANAILMMEGVGEGKNKAFPKARMFIYYDIGRGKQTALLLNDFKKTADRVLKEGGARWLKLTTGDGDPIWILPHLVKHMIETSEEEREAAPTLGLTAIDVEIARELLAVSVNETIEDVLGEIALTEPGGQPREADDADEEASPAAERKGAQPRKAPAPKKSADPKKSRAAKVPPAKAAALAQDDIG